MSTSIGNTSMSSSTTFSDEEDDTEEYISTLSSIFCKEQGIEKFLSFMALHLQQLVENNELLIRYTRDKQRTEREIFDCLEVPKMSLHRYVMLLTEDMDCSPSCYLIAYIYLIRFCRNDGLLIGSLNIHRLLLVCIVVAVKFWEVKCYTNAIFASMGGVSVHDLNKMEWELVSVINFDLVVTLEEFLFFCDNLQIVMDEECLSPSPHYLRDVFFCVDDPRFQIVEC